jgi:predicted HTH transcriptional regulator
MVGGIPDDKAFLLRLIREGEYQRQDFKYRVADACKLAKSVSAFANTDGGRLLIGVRDDGNLSGVRSEEEIFMMHQAAYRYCKPEPSISFDGSSTYTLEEENK